MAYTDMDLLVALWRAGGSAYRSALEAELRHPETGVAELGAAITSCLAGELIEEGKSFNAGFSGAGENTRVGDVEYRLTAKGRKMLDDSPEGWTRHDPD
jgi:hypothetical protein